MNYKKNLKRKSNWYIYLLTLMITTAVLFAVVYLMRGVLFSETETVVNKNGTSDFRPPKSFDALTLLMLSEQKGATPDYYCLVSYQPRAEKVVFVTLRSDLSVKGGTSTMKLSDVYDRGGAKSAVKAITETYSLPVKFYAKFDKAAFIDIVSQIGNAPVNIPAPFQSGGTSFQAGSQNLDAESLYNYITYKQRQMDDDDGGMVMGGALSKLIDANTRSLDTSRLQTIFAKLMNSADTSYTSENFNDNLSAYLYTAGNSVSFAEYYVPYGETDSKGRFIPAENSIGAVRERFGL
ncbi:MAG: LCP family protein [Oscillospiraceae bacterium]|jgi:anionic cell wall polymer biosynthesis LytR-Cps2A-Psr (LCP) family protein|nr:LCP family protein [Oscillospiraceae bacterium]